MRRRIQWSIGIACAVLVLLCLAVVWLAQPSAAPGAIRWRLQPDSFPLGTLVQGSRVEMSLGVFSGLKPAPTPAWLARLPKPARKVAESIVEGVRALSARFGLQTRIEVPAFIKLERTQVALHPAAGPYAVISFRLKTESPGDWAGNLVIHLKGSAYGSTNLLVPVKVKVVAPPPAASRAVLIVETPYEAFATENGKEFEPLSRLNARLAAQGVRLDYCRHLSGPLSGYRTVLLAGSELARLSAAQTERLRQFVAGGGRLILAANAFFVPTVPRANIVLASYGLEVIDQDAARSITNSLVSPDALTAGVKAVDFYRPSPVTVTDPAQAKLLVKSGDSQTGFVAVSRQGARGEVIVLAQSLWWSWIQSEPEATGNRLLLENLLAH